MKLSIIIPVLDEAANIESALAALQPLRDRGAEIIVVDGGSTDDTASLARSHCDHVTTSSQGRASQQNAGAQHASGDTLLFLHTDTRLPDSADLLIDHALRDKKMVWGRFDVMLDPGDGHTHPMFKVIAAMMNFRSRLSGIATGDQCIFVRKLVFDAVGGFPELPLMEDIALSKSLNTVSRPACLHQRVSTSARRWQKHGVWRTMALMWWLRFAYWIGFSPATLARWYGYQ